jgi:NCS1 family nucleobase:cation symporter-1
MASGLVGQGLSPWLAVLNVILGNVIVLIPIQLNSHAGTKYGIPFPVFARLTFGVRGAQLPSLSRAITACGWNGVQCGVGGAAVMFLVKALFPSLDNSTMTAAWIGFFIFLILTWLITSFGSKTIRIFESVGSPILVIMSVALFVWALVIASKAGYSFGDVVSSDISAGEVKGGFLLVFLGGLTANIAFWATMALNIPDFSRYAKSQKAQFRGQLYGMPLAMAVCAIIGAIYAQATFLAQLAVDETGKAIPLFSPTDALNYIGTGGGARAIMFFVGIGVIIATLTTNVAANVVAPANGFSNISPKKISYRLGTTFACLIAIIYFALNLSGSAAGPMFTFLNVYGGILAPVAAIFIADYYIVKKRNLDVQALYMGSGGRYWYQSGWNLRAILAWVLGAIIPTVVSILQAAGVSDIPAVLTWINANAYIFGFVVAFILYILFMQNEKGSSISDEEEAALTEV